MLFRAPAAAGVLARRVSAVPVVFRPVVPDHVDPPFLDAPPGGQLRRHVGRKPPFVRGVGGLAVPGGAASRSRPGLRAGASALPVAGYGDGDRLHPDHGLHAGPDGNRPVIPGPAAGTGFAISVSSAGLAVRFAVRRVAGKGREHQRDRLDVRRSRFPRSETHVHGNDGDGKRPADLPPDLAGDLLFRQPERPGLERRPALVAGFQHDGTPALRVEGYVKRYDDYVAEAGNVVTGPPINAGYAAGVDVLVRPQAVGPLHGWLTYSYLKAELELEDGARVPSQYDVTHSLTAVAKLSFGASELGFTARYATGRPFTPILGAAPSAPGEPPEPIYGPLHSRRMPDYFRLDGRLTQLLPFFGGGVLIAFVEALNLLDRDNVTMYTYDAAYQNRRPVPNFFGDRIFLVGVEARL